MNLDINLILYSYRSTDDCKQGKFIKVVSLSPGTHLVSVRHSALEISFSGASEYPLPQM